MSKLIDMIMDCFEGGPKPADSLVKKEPVVDWASIIWGYINSFHNGTWSSAGSDKARKECENRGLAYGHIRITKGDYHAVEICPIGEQKLTSEQVKDAINKAVIQLKLASEVIVRDGYKDEVEVIIARENSTLKGNGTCSARGSYTTFASASCWGGGVLREMRAPSEQALRVLLHALASLGFPAGAKHYTHESPVKIEDIVLYAVRWEDPQSGCRYLDVLFRPELVKHEVWHGSNSTEKRIEGSFKGLVLACRNANWWPKVTINNKPVYSTIIETPTTPMLKAKERLIKESIRNCACGKPATQQVRLIRFEIDDGFGGFSSGGINYTCNNETCLNKAKSSKCVRVETSPFKQEVWE